MVDLSVKFPTMITVAFKTMNRRSMFAKFLTEMGSFFRLKGYHITVAA